MSAAIDISALGSEEPIAICPFCKHGYDESEFYSHPTFRVVRHFAGSPDSFLADTIDCMCKAHGRATLSTDHLVPCADCNDGGWVWGRAENGDPIHAPCRCRKTA